MVAKIQFQPPSTEFLLKLGYRFSRNLLTHTDCYAENYMWRAVVVSALEDTMIDRTDRKSATLKVKAHNWILSECSDFDRVCNWAMLDPESVCEAYTGAIKQKKITFKNKHIQWHKYNNLFQKLQITYDSAKKKNIKKEMKQIRKDAVLGACVLVTSIFLSVIT